jgi:hypothetical protein
LKEHTPCPHSNLTSIEPIWEQFSALYCPSGRPTIRLAATDLAYPTGILFEKLVEVLVVRMCAYHRIADEECSATTLRRRRETSGSKPG